MQFTDAVTVAGTRRTGDGYLVADARIARTGIQIYAGSEVGKPDMAMARVYRPGAEVFADATMKSAAHRPVTNEHPDQMVTSDNWKQFAVGQTSDEISGEGVFIRVPLMVSDGATIKLIEDGKRELSAGYTCDLDWTGGKTPSGEAYDAVQRNIRINHVAIVHRGRAGSQVRIGDGAKWGASPVQSVWDDKHMKVDVEKARKWLKKAIERHERHMNGDESTSDASQQKMMDEMNEALAALEGGGGKSMSMDTSPAKGSENVNTKTVLVDGLSVETTDAGAQAIAKLQADLAASAAKLTDAQNDHTKAIAAKDADLAKKDAEIDGLKAKVLSDADLDKKVAGRADLIAKAKTIAKDVKTDGLPDAAIRRAAVVAKLGDAAVADKADAYIDARFDILVEDAAKNPADPFRQVVQSGIQPVNDSGTSATAHKAMTDHLTSAWQNPTKGAA